MKQKFSNMEVSRLYMTNYKATEGTSKGYGDNGRNGSMTNSLTSPYDNNFALRVSSKLMNQNSTKKNKMVPMPFGTYVFESNKEMSSTGEVTTIPTAKERNSPGREVKSALNNYSRKREEQVSHRVADESIGSIN